MMLQTDTRRVRMNGVLKFSITGFFGLFLFLYKVMPHLYLKNENFRGPVHDVELEYTYICNEMKFREFKDITRKKPENGQ